MRDRSKEKGMRPIPPLPPRSEEHIDISGHLNVPVAKAMDKAPKREGWEPYWVHVNLNDPIQKVVKYQRVPGEPRTMTDQELLAYALAHTYATHEFTGPDEARIYELLLEAGEVIGVEVPEGDEYQRAVLHHLDPERVPDFPLDH